MSDTNFEIKKRDALCPFLEQNCPSSHLLQNECGRDRRTLTTGRQQLPGISPDKEDAKDEGEHFGHVDGPPNAVDAHEGGQQPDAYKLED